MKVDFDSLLPPAHFSGHTLEKKGDHCCMARVCKITWPTPSFWCDLEALAEKECKIAS